MGQVRGELQYVVESSAQQWNNLPSKHVCSSVFRRGGMHRNCSLFWGRQASCVLCALCRQRLFVMVDLTRKKQLPTCCPV